MTLSLKIEGIDKLVAKLNVIEAAKYLRPFMSAAVAEIKDGVAVYPPATDANNSMARRWYERGYGPRWQRRDGSVGGRRTSERLGTRWTTKVTNGGLTGEVGNNASYARYVQDRVKQAWFHRRTGWVTAQDVLEERGPRVLEMLDGAIAQVLNQ
jgi:hypothetical protein